MRSGCLLWGRKRHMAEQQISSASASRRLALRCQAQAMKASVTRDDWSRVLQIEPVGQFSPNGLHERMNVLTVGKGRHRDRDSFRFVIGKAIFGFDKPAREQHSFHAAAKKPAGRPRARKSNKSGS